jgi:transposase-like protein
MARERRLFSEEFKREAVKLVGQPGASKAAIARDLGIGANLLGRWCRDANVDAEVSGCARRYPARGVRAHAPRAGKGQDGARHIKKPPTRFPWPS